MSQLTSAGICTSGILTFVYCGSMACRAGASSAYQNSFWRAESGILARRRVCRLIMTQELRQQWSHGVMDESG